MSTEAGMDQLPVVYEDDALFIVNKPSGMLSQPGLREDGSVLTRVLDSGRDLHGPVLVHRLDMDTSGLLILAKKRDVHRMLSKQFENRLVRKRYKAMLVKPVKSKGGIIRLPIRLDIDDRPRQIVCAEHGKTSTTLWHKTHGSSHGSFHGKEQTTALANNERLITLYPLTGRTHQLRVHTASPSGLGNAISGDRLYANGVQTNRLMLHADMLQFVHPLTQEPLSIFSPSFF